MALVLIADDSITARAFCRKALTLAGHEVVEATCGQEALDLTAARRPACLVLDLLMPDMSGLDVMRALAAAGARPPVVVLSADIQETVREEVMALGATAFLNKPSPVAALQAAVAAALAGGGPRP